MVMNVEKLFNKCIMINKWYYKTIVLNIGPRMRPPGSPARARPVRPAAARSVRPAAARSRLLG